MTARRAWWRLVDRAVELVVGRRCAGCDAEVTQALFCGACAATVERAPPRTEIHASVVLGGPVPGAIHRLKYRDRPDLARPLGELLAGTLPPLDVDVVVPVPLHPWRLAERGYNQAGLLASRVARLRGWRTMPVGLTRRRYTRSQTTLGRRERLTSLEGAFAGSRRLADKRLLIVDDVTTTGATLRACAAAAREAGAAAVRLATVAVAPE